MRHRPLQLTPAAGRGTQKPRARGTAAVAHLEPDPTVPVHCHVSLRDNPIADVGLSVILRDLYDSRCLLVALDVSRNKLGVRGAACLADAFLHEGVLSLTALNVSCCGLTGKGVCTLALALSRRPFDGPIDVDLSSNVPRCGAGADGGRLIGDAVGILLGTSHTLTTLRSNRNAIDEHGVQVLAQSLEANGVLSTLELAECGIRDIGGVQISRSLASNCTLTALDLSGNELAPEATETFAAAISVNSSLQRLNLSRNHANDTVGLALGRALAANTALTHLMLRGGPATQTLRASGAAAVVRGSHNRLRVVDLSGHAFGNDGLASIARELLQGSGMRASRGRRLQRLGLAGCGATVEGTAAFLNQYALASNDHATARSVDLRRNSGATEKKLIAVDPSVAHSLAMLAELGVQVNLGE